MNLSVAPPWKSVFLGGGTQRSLLARPSPFPSALIKRGDSRPPLPRVELIQKVSTILIPKVSTIQALVELIQKVSTNTKSKHQYFWHTRAMIGQAAARAVAQRVQVAEHTLRRHRVHPQSKKPHTQDDLAFPTTLPSSDD